MSRFVEILHGRARDLGRVLPRHAREDDGAARSRCRPHRDELSVLRDEEGAGVRRREPDGLPGEPHRRAAATASRRLWIQVVVPVTSLCPCSKKISDYGAHNQRSHVTIKAKLRRHIWIEELIASPRPKPPASCTASSSAPTRSTSPSAPTTTRSSSKTWCATSRSALNDDERVAAYVVEAENFESIHNHSAYALIERDKDAVVGLTARPCPSGCIPLHRAAQRATACSAPSAFDALDAGDSDLTQHGLMRGCNRPLRLDDSSSLRPANASALAVVCIVRCAIPSARSGVIERVP